MPPIEKYVKIFNFPCKLSCHEQPCFFTCVCHSLGLYLHQQAAIGIGWNSQIERSAGVLVPHYLGILQRGMLGLVQSCDYTMRLCSSRGFLPTSPSLHSILIEQVLEQPYMEGMNILVLEPSSLNLGARCLGVCQEMPCPALGVLKGPWSCGRIISQQSHLPRGNGCPNPSQLHVWQPRESSLSHLLFNFVCFHSVYQAFQAKLLI